MSLLVTLTDKHIEDIINAYKRADGRNNILLAENLVNFLFRNGIMIEEDESGVTWYVNKKFKKGI